MKAIIDTCIVVDAYPTMDSVFSISVPKLPSTPRSADIFQPMNVLLYQPPGAYSSLSSLLLSFIMILASVFFVKIDF